MVRVGESQKGERISKEQGVYLTRLLLRTVVDSQKNWRTSIKMPICTI